MHDRCQAGNGRLHRQLPAELAQPAALLFDPLHHLAPFAAGDGRLVVGKVADVLESGWSGFYPTASQPVLLQLLVDAARLKGCYTAASSYGWAGLRSRTALQLLHQRRS